MLRRLAVALALLAAGAGAATLLGVGSAGAGQTPTSQNVREQNLDAQGNIKVHEQGTPQVSLTGSPRVGLDPTLGNTVKIDTNANRVQVDQPASQPFLTQAADNPAFTPVEVTRTDDTGAAVLDLYTVPAHEVLVIEEFSAETRAASAPTPDPGLRYAFLANSVGNLKFAMPLTDPANQGTSVGSMQTRIYLQPGDDVVCQFFIESSGGFCSISGYLVAVK